MSFLLREIAERVGAQILGVFQKHKLPFSVFMCFCDLGLCGDMIGNADLVREFSNRLCCRNDDPFGE